MRVGLTKTKRDSLPTARRLAALGMTTGRLGTKCGEARNDGEVVGLMDKDC